ncbi:MAG: Uma2 family endonuclease [Polyangiaceae bacterium]|nr:Uma2 family endonuclease [Polyangiaceae bacterium]
MNVGALLVAGLRDKGCTVLSSDQKLGLGQGNRYVYADVTVVCGPLGLQPGTDDVLENPSIVVAVLSHTTEQYDRGLKWDGCSSEAGYAARTGGAAYWLSQHVDPSEFWQAKPGMLSATG